MTNKCKNTQIGWALFTFSLIVYLLTLSPTVSFWDCGEFLASANKLEVGHPPGAPLYLIISRVFASLGTNAHNSTILINAVSAVSSAATVMFLYWTIVLILDSGCLENKKTYRAKQIGATIGALTFAFTDTFWFSAVEAEVYALSSLFTSLVFWSILKWRESGDTIYSRWILLIFYFIGLSIGVHLLNLLAIPAIVFVVYQHHYEVRFKNSIIALLISAAFVLFVNYGIIPGIPLITSKLEFFAVNTLSLPKHTGIFIFISLFLLSFIFFNRYSLSRDKVKLNLWFNSFALIVLGYSCYTTIVVRTAANPPLNENAPSDMFRLQEYLNREQYGSRPLFYGNYYTAPVIGHKEGSPKYFYESGKYVKYTGSYTPKYDQRFNTFFPRMYSSRGQHPKVYESWTDQNGKWLNITESGLTRKVYRPSQIDNFTFFSTYQLGHMYFRYFMWNFVGRQNEVQGYGDALYGNWISGIPALDKLMVGEQSLRPDNKNTSKSHNTYLFLPLILGLIGLYIQATTKSKEAKDFNPLVLLFIATGIAIVVYLNQTPLQARERDYAYVGSFYTFSIWIGLGAFYLLEIATKTKSVLYLYITGLLLLLIPARVLQQNWNDHDRSRRFLAKNIAKNTLALLSKDAILFTYGDNDTFPLWYLQEVQDTRTDIRVCNTSLLSTNWYIEQMQRKVYDSSPLPIIFMKGKGAKDIRDYIPVISRLEKPFLIDPLMHQWIGSKDIRTKVKMQSGKRIDYIPSKTVALPINKNDILKGFLKDYVKGQEIKDTLFIPLKGNGIMKSDLMILNMLSNYHWERPLVFDPSALEGIQLDLKKLVRFDGLTYTLVPFKFDSTEKLVGQYNEKNLLGNLSKYQWEQLGEKDVFWDDTSIRTLKSAKVKQAYANTLVKLMENKSSASVKTLWLDYRKYILDTPGMIGDEDTPFAAKLLDKGYTEEGEELINKIFNHSYQWIQYYISLPDYLSNSYQDRVQKNVSTLSNCVQIVRQQNNHSKLEKELNMKLDLLIQELE
ncbi:DUF2723 domain-containing protein [Halosquirtibacter laminarini]|uniref:DUF2723 domain-containing protein n=1 Tax=Halosquirtibacter laminarini TaxID=3374600 RepID=A0AC61NHL1_9BACT|nr:DUF2723 domain-containing protein [Prolixibacteraceae bacterium]